MSKSKDFQMGRQDVRVEERDGADRAGESGDQGRTGMVRDEGDLRGQVSEAYNDGARWLMAWCRGIRTHPF